jgi:hypothetical protein
MIRKAGECDAMAPRCGIDRERSRDRFRVTEIVSLAPAAQAIGFK